MADRDALLVHAVGVLPRPWPGARARDVVARCWAELHERAPRDSRPALFRVYADITREAAERTRH
ncbi:hypothetical protein AB0939_09020 [Streptomyces sp. NPDC006990]|uniref:hypothetical protein n=1 Tax=unclassified Streptomyces TaxID=2593676 RepID=UPI0034534565